MQYHATLARRHRRPRGTAPRTAGPLRHGMIMLALAALVMLAAGAAAAGADVPGVPGTTHEPWVPRSGSHREAERRRGPPAFLPACGAKRCNADGLCRRGMRVQSCGRGAAEDGVYMERPRLGLDAASCGMGACGGRDDVIDAEAAAGVDVGVTLK